MDTEPYISTVDDLDKFLEEKVLNSHMLLGKLHTGLS